MKHKKTRTIKEPRKLIAFLLIIYIIFVMLFMLSNFSKKITITELTGHTSIGVLRINLGVTAPVTVTPPETHHRVPIEELVGCISNWQCEDWSECNVNNIRLRDCVDVNECSSPMRESQECAAKARVEMPIPPSILLKLKEKIGNTSILNIILLAIILCLLIITSYLYKTYAFREIKRDLRLKKYILVALKNGFSENTIRARLMQHGISAEQINSVFNEIKREREKLDKSR